MSSSNHSPDDSTRPAWHAAVRETAGRPDLADRLARPASDLLLRFGETYARLTVLPRAQRRRLQRRLGVGLAGAALLLALGLVPTPALAGGVVGTGDAASCTDAALDTALSGGGSVTFNCGGAAHTITVASTKTLSADITIDGGGLITLDGGGANQVISINSGVTVTLSNLTISGGSATDGGGIYNNSGTLTIQNSTITGNSASVYGGGMCLRDGSLTMMGSTLSGNSASAYGGGIYSSQSTMVVQNSTLSGNSAGGGGGIAAVAYTMLIMQNSTLSGNSASNGGGILNFGGSTLTVQASTISGNSASSGGGIRNHESTLTVQASTLSGNSAGSGGGIYVYSYISTVTMQNSTLSGNSAGSGGGIFNKYGTVTVQNSTLSGNSAGSGGGIFASYNTVTVQNSIVALQTTGDDCTEGTSGTITTGGYNIESADTCGFTGTGDQQNVTSGDLNLGSLAANGGPTQTIALGAGSVAIDTIADGTNGCVAGTSTDQRGAVRAGGAGRGGSACDIGAYEANSSQHPNAVALRGLTAAGGSAGGWLAALGAGLAAVLGGLVVGRRGGLEREDTKGREGHEARRSRSEVAGAGYGPPAIVYEAPLEARAGSPLSLPLEELIE